MGVSVTTERTATGGKATARVTPDAGERDRQAILRLLAEKGFEHALPTIAHGVAVELVQEYGAGVDERLGLMAARAETAVLDALAVFARGQGWRPS